MPRRTGYRTRNASTTLILGDPDLGTISWDTEYDVEFCEVPRREEQAQIEDVKQSARASLRTPRSLKKGFVSGQDYEKLDEQYNNVLEAYRDMQMQVAALEHRMGTMQGNEHQLLRAVEEQHGLIDTLRQQVGVMGESVGQLMSTVERNKSLLTVMSNVQEVSPSKPLKANEEMKVQDSRELQSREVQHGEAQDLVSSVSKRLGTLEAKIGDIANAVVALSRAQEAMLLQQGDHAAPAPAPGSGAAGRQGGSRARRQSTSEMQSDDGRLSNDGRRSKHEREGNSGKRTAERIERLPNPLKLTSRSSIWKP